MLVVSGAVLLAASSEPADTSAVSATVTAAANRVVDGEVITHVKTALSGEPSLTGLNIAVIATKGDIRLTGVVQSQSQIETALRVARAAEGGHAIHDE